MPSCAPCSPASRPIRARGIVPHAPAGCATAGDPDAWLHADDHGLPAIATRTRRTTRAVIRGSGSSVPATWAPRWAVAMLRAGWPVAAVASRDPARVERFRRRWCPPRAPCPSRPSSDEVDLVFVTVPDDAIPEVAGAAAAATVARRSCTPAAPCPADVLAPALAAGSSAGSFHPLVAFADLERSVAALRGATVALEGDAGLLTLLAELAGGPGRPAGAACRRAARPPITRRRCSRRVASWASWTPSRRWAAAPASTRRARSPSTRRSSVRRSPTRRRWASRRRSPGRCCAGDVSTVRGHLDAIDRLAPRARELYRAAARREVALAVGRGDLGADRAAALEAVLGRRRMRPELSARALRRGRPVRVAARPHPSARRREGRHAPPRGGTIDTCSTGSTPSADHAPRSRFVTPHPRAASLVHRGGVPDRLRPVAARSSRSVGTPAACVAVRAAARAACGTIGALPVEQERAAMTGASRDALVTRPGSPSATTAGAAHRRGAARERSPRQVAQRARHLRGWGGAAPGRTRAGAGARPPTPRARRDDLVAAQGHPGRAARPLEQTALREVTEETGLLVRILAPVGPIEYRFVQRGVRIHKTVHYFLMEADRAAPRPTTTTSSTRSAGWASRKRRRS